MDPDTAAALRQDLIKMLAQAAAGAGNGNPDVFSTELSKELAAGFAGGPAGAGADQDPDDAG